MFSASKDLSALGSILEVSCSNEIKPVTSGTLQYKSGTGTIIVEATLELGEDAIWFAVDDFEGTPVSRTGVGATSFPIHAFMRIRARNTVVGAGNRVLLSVGS